MKTAKMHRLTKPACIIVSKMKTSLRKTRPLSFKLLFCWCRKTYFCRHTVFGRDETDSSSIFIFVCFFFVSWIGVIVIAHCIAMTIVEFGSTRRIGSIHPFSEMHSTIMRKTVYVWQCHSPYGRSSVDKFGGMWLESSATICFPNESWFILNICFQFICIYWTRAIVFADSPF